MTFDYVKQAVVDDYNDFYFEYNGVNCGVEIDGDLSKFNLLYGDDIQKVDGDFDSAVRVPFFGGRSVLDIFDSVADSIRFV